MLHECSCTLAAKLPPSSKLPFLPYGLSCSGSSDAAAASAAGFASASSAQAGLAAPAKTARPSAHARVNRFFFVSSSFGVIMSWLSLEAPGNAQHVPQCEQCSPRDEDDRHVRQHE